MYPKFFDEICKKQENPWERRPQSAPEPVSKYTERKNGESPQHMDDVLRR